MRRLPAILLKYLRNKYVRIGLAIFIALLIMNVAMNMLRQRRQYITQRIVRQNLTVSVVEGGNLLALNSQQVMNVVPGSRTILDVVSEGTEVTAADVAAGKVLIKLDSKDLEDRVQQVEITVENSWSSFRSAQENLSIQQKQNESDIRQNELKARMARIDLEKYLGKKVAQDLIAGGAGDGDFSRFIKSPDIGGEALNQKRKLENGIDLAGEERARADDRASWSNKLADKGYISNSEREADRLALKQKSASTEQSDLEYQLFLVYDFPKQTEKLFSDFKEAGAELERTRVRCASRYAQAEADVKSKNAGYLLNKANLDDMKKQIQLCTIRATQPGFVTYSTQQNPWRSEPFQPGTAVRQYQQLLSLPDFASMGVEVKIHESAVEKVTVGMKARVTIDAFSGKSFSGTVQKIALMPDPTLKWLNPDVNVYVARIALDESSPLFKPGMSAEVEIIVKEMKNVVAVPLAAVSFRNGRSSCTVLKGVFLEERPVSLGEMTTTMAEVTTGLREGDTVVFAARKTAGGEPSGRKQERQESSGKQETPGVSPGTGTSPQAGAPAAGGATAAPATKGDRGGNRNSSR